MVVVLVLSAGAGVAGVASAGGVAAGAGDGLAGAMAGAGAGVVVVVLVEEVESSFLPQATRDIASNDATSRVFFMFAFLGELMSERVLGARYTRLVHEAFESRIC